MNNISKLLYLSRAQVTTVTNPPLWGNYDTAWRAAVTVVISCHRKFSIDTGRDVAQGDANRTTGAREGPRLPQPAMRSWRRRPRRWQMSPSGDGENRPRTDTRSAAQMCAVAGHEIGLP
jgi:hypothetical protein